MSDSPPPHDPSDSSAKTPTSTEGWHQMAGAGFEFIVAVGMFGAVGYGLDWWLGTGPWLLISGFGFGFAVGLYILVKMANRTFRD